jgi:hypothetical protein
MIVTLQSTEKIVELVVNGQTVPARIWEGKTAAGVRCHAYITRIAVLEQDDAGEFELDLKEHRKPTPAVEAIPLRMVL